VKPVFHVLDVTEVESISTFRRYLIDEYGNIDIVVHNAAFQFPDDTEEPFELQASEMMRVNFFGSLRLADTLAPLLRSGARMVFVGCSAGSLSIVKESKRRFLLDKKLTEEDLVNFMSQYMFDVEKDKWQEAGWPSDPFGMSKLGVGMLSRLYHNRFAQKRAAAVDEVRKELQAAREVRREQKEAELMQWKAHRSRQHVTYLT